VITIARKNKDVYDYETDLKIDHNALDIEWLEQSNNFFKYSEQLADARKELDKAKENADVVIAELKNSIRKDPKEYLGDIKTTEGSINEVVLIDEECQEARNDIIQLKHKVEILSSAVKSFEHRKTALENLVRLLGQQYFSAPADPRDIDNEMVRKKKQKSADDKVKNRMKNK